MTLSKAMAVFHKIVKLVKNGVLMIIHIYAKVSKGLKMTKQINTLFAVLMMVLLMIVTRGHIKSPIRQNLSLC
jgi:hypothetical protein